MEGFYQSCDNFQKYPKNLIGQNALSHTLQAYLARLDNRSGRLQLFDERKAAVDFWDLKKGDTGELSNRTRRTILTKLSTTARSA
jgi:hypothetical protein